MGVAFESDDRGILGVDVLLASGVVPGSKSSRSWNEWYVVVERKLVLEWDRGTEECRDMLNEGKGEVTMAMSSAT